MTLQQIREKFINESGRFDLVSDTTPGSFADNGANFFVQAGLRLLDMMQETPKSLQTYRKDISIGDYGLEFKHCRTIEAVEMMNATDDRFSLELKSLSWMRDEYGDVPSDVTQGAPAYYSPVANVLSPDQYALTVANYTDDFTYDYYDITFKADGVVPWEYTGILWMPPTDSVYTCVVHGFFFSLMENDTDVSYWSVAFPELLVMATNLALETFYRNTEGVKDWLGAIRLWLKGIDDDLVRQEMARAGNQMKG